MNLLIMTTFWFKALQAINYVSLSLQTEKISLDDEMKLIVTLVEDHTRLRSSWPSLINEAHLIATDIELHVFQSNFVEKQL